MKPDLVLIDDDELIRSTWKFMAERKGHHFICFSHPDEFDYSIDKDVPIYVDYAFDENKIGGAVAGNFLSKGYEKVFITTGYAKETIAAPKNLAGVVGKSYPA